MTRIRSSAVKVLAVGAIVTATALGATGVASATGGTTPNGDQVWGNSHISYSDAEQSAASQCSGPYITDLHSTYVNGWYYVEGTCG